MEEFSFSIPQGIFFGDRIVTKLPKLASKLGGKKAFIISGPHLKRIGLVGKCSEELENGGVQCESFTETEANPSTDTVHKAAESFVKSGADMIIAIGGGSPLDVAKAVAVVAKFGGNINDYEGVSKIPGPVVPIIAVPTTAGTGSEVTAFSVITDHSRNYKLTIGSEYILPRYALLDPELIESVPEKTAAACGIDALVHAIEAYVSLKASPFSDMMALKAIELIGGNLCEYVENRGNKDAARSMMQGSLFAGIAFSHARLGNVHAMSHPVSAYFDVPHGLANAILLPTVIEYNGSATIEKYYDIYRCLSSGREDGREFDINTLVDEIKSLSKKLGIPSGLKEVGVKEEFFEKMSTDAMKSGNIKVNPRKTTYEDIMKLYKKAY